MKIGVPKEIKIHEYRVGLTPASVREFVAHGHSVLVQAGLIDPEGLPLAGAEVAAKLKDPTLPSNTLIDRCHRPVHT